MNREHRKFKHILLCDDDDDDRFFFKDAIREVDSSLLVKTVNNCEQLIRTLHDAENIPDLLFLDLNMPRIDGKQCLEQIRQNPKFEKLPVIIYSTSAHGTDIDETYAKGANLYLQKSSNFSTFKNIITEVLTSDRLNTKPPLKEKFVLYRTD